MYKVTYDTIKVLSILKGLKEEKVPARSVTVTKNLMEIWLEDGYGDWLENYAKEYNIPQGSVEFFGGEAIFIEEDGVFIYGTKKN